MAQMDRQMVISRWLCTIDAAALAASRVAITARALVRLLPRDRGPSGPRPPRPRRHPTHHHGLSARTPRHPAPPQAPRHLTHDLTRHRWPSWATSSRSRASRNRRRAHGGGLGGLERAAQRGVQSACASCTVVRVDQRARRGDVSRRVFQLALFTQRPAPDFHCPSGCGRD